MIFFAYPNAFCFQMENVSSSTLRMSSSPFGRFQLDLAISVYSFFLIIGQAFEQNVSHTITLVCEIMKRLEDPYIAGKVSFSPILIVAS